MDLIDYPYVGQMRYANGATFPAQWCPALPGAKVFPFSNAFFSSRWDNVPFDVGAIGEIREDHPTYSWGDADAGLLGFHVCGSQQQWQEGWPVGTPPSPYPGCCGGFVISSIGLDMPVSTFVVTPPVLTTDGTFNVTFSNQTPGTFFKAPTGAPGAPVWGTILASDVPALDASKIVSGVFSVAQIPGLPASILTSGTLSTSVLPASVPTLNTGFVSGSVGTTPVTILNISAPGGIVGVVTVKILSSGANSGVWQGSVTDLFGVTDPSFGGPIPRGSQQQFNLSTPISGPTFPPYQDFLLQLASPSSPTCNYEVAWALVY